MTLRQRRQRKPTPFAQRAFDAAVTILEASGLRYQSQQIDGLAAVLMLFAEKEMQIRQAHAEPESADAVDPHVGSTGTPSTRDKSSSS